MDVQSVLTRPRASRAGVVQLPVGEIEPNPNQPRRDFDAEALSELAASIAEDNLFVVVTARKGTVSYKAALDHLQDELAQHFRGQNLMIVYPDQNGVAGDIMTYAAPQQPGERSAYELLKEWFEHTAGGKKHHNFTKQDNQK